MDPEKLQQVATIAGPIIVGVFVLLAIARKFLAICQPNEILILSGRNRITPDGRTVGYRVVAGGRTLRIPLIETIERMDMTLISVPMTVQGAYSEGGIPLAVHAIANVKVASDRKFMGNAIERFLGRGREEIARVAKETMEGHLRGVLATMTPEEVNEDRLKFAEQLTDEAQTDLHKLGLQLDTLKIQHVTDDRNYLDSIGRKRIAEIHRTAEVAESNAVREAEEAEATAHARAQIAATNAQANIQRKQNQLRQIRAELYAEAKSMEERAQASADAARAEEEKELQTIRGELEQLRLEADITIPAEADRQVRVLRAAGDAAPIAENGRAQAEALAHIAAAWKESGGQAMNMFVLQRLDEIFEQVANAASKLQVREVNLIDAGDGKTMPAYLSAYPAAVGALLKEVSTTLGVDITRILQGTNGVSTASMPSTAKPLGGALTPRT